eukprot:1844344-Heterocapsa_arctica.AAC.1
MGLWTWAMLVARPSLSIPDTVFKWMNSAESLAKPRKLWQSVKDEVVALAAMSIYFEANLTLP